MKTWKAAAASFLALVAALALGGCATWLYSKPGAGHAETKADMFACRDQTAQPAPPPSAGALTWAAIGEALSVAALGPGGAGMATQPESVDPAHQARIDACMAMKGYTR